jgi:hypothetical protein
LLATTKFAILDNLRELVLPNSRNCFPLKPTLDYLLTSARPQPIITRVKIKGLPVTLIVGVAAVAVYLIFTAVALLKFPSEYSPLTNWLSDLGNPQINQSGAIFYNLGCIFTSVILLLFFFRLNELNTGERKNRIILTIAQISGLLSTLFLILTALFPLGVNTPIHALTGKMHIIFLGFFLTFSATALLRHPVSIKWLAYFGFAAALINFVYGAFLNSVFVAEWLAIGMFIIYVLLISSNSRFLANDKTLFIKNSGQIKN